MGETAWSPWRYLGEQWPQITVYEMELPGDALGYTNYTDSIWLTYGLNQAERRCTLAHEIGHLERGPLPDGATQAMQDAEELAVDQWAARKLIAMCGLVRAFAWSLHLDEIAEELWVDRRTLRARLRAATDDEQDRIMLAIAKRQQAA